MFSILFIVTFNAKSVSTSVIDGFSSSESAKEAGDKVANQYSEGRIDCSFSVIEKK